MGPTTILILGGVVAIILLVIGLIVTATEQKSLVDDRLEYLESDETGPIVPRKAVIGEWVGKQATRYTWGQSLGRSLARADIKMKVGEFILMTVILTLVGALIGWFLGGGSGIGKGVDSSQVLMGLPGIIIGGAIGFFAPTIYLKRQQGKRLLKFDNQLADMLSLMVNGLRAGYSIMQALEAVSRELPPPISDEFRRVVQEMQLGIPMDVSLDNLMRRIPSKDLDLVVTAMNVQREVGGNLAEIMEKISHTIRERVRVKGEIRVLTSQVMMSGRLLAIMPVAVIVLMYFINRQYMMRFFNPATRMFGIPALIIGAIMIVIGYFTMQKIASIEI
ncbi:MAG: secretion system protein [Anaerolineales bacterium]|nr:MAG: secretion system protein [Anaerolineales bacterium]